MAKKKATPRKSKKEEPTKKRRPRSRGKGRNKKTAVAHATNAATKASGSKRKVKSKTPQDPNSQNEPPETFAPGPSISILDGTDSINRERAIINKMLDHDEWEIPKQAFQLIPQKLNHIGMNAGPAYDEAGN